MMMLSVIFVAMLFIPLASAQPEKRGGDNCKAYWNRYGPDCESDTVSLPRPGATIQYQITVSGNARICCYAYTCSRHSCYMKYIGCGHGTWSSSPLPWEGGNIVATPRLKCKTRNRRTVRYDYKTIH
ncbi:uncharacterized protein LOC128548414 [Mercenaria mercenaria]|uniref:uncharacterized protein LOC128548414 n=1 Tax=Mercenaria mercenaria TaxID=6596 RepID=UPI00234F5AE9|nr:uncharacterized protein LOC128548414 [Mercenaria mercenaria]